MSTTYGCAPRWYAQHRLPFGAGNWLTIAYCSYPKEYRVRVYRGGRSEPELDYFTDDFSDAVNTAEDMRKRLAQ